jgi:hypothetical protein
MGFQLHRYVLSVSVLGGEHFNFSFISMCFLDYDLSFDFRVRFCRSDFRVSKSAV